MSEPREIRLKRLRMRAARRGTREMDLILGPFAEARLTGLPAEELVNFESLLSENDQDLYQWISGRCTIPSKYREIVGRIRSHHGAA
jgi:antitoxin CptB